MQEHDALVALAARLANAVDSTSVVPIPAVAARDALSDALIRHLHTEDSMIYPLLMGGKDASAAAAAHDFVAEFKDLIGDWTTYMGAWPETRIAAEWPAFTSVTLDLIRRLSGRVRRENELLYPLALAAAHIPLRARPES
ncbi:hemerythrin domain-containing protein [Sphingomonas sp. UYAg733]